MEETTVRVKQRHRSAEEWRVLVTEWKQSGKTRHQWCREQGVGKESLRRWTKRLRGTDESAAFVQIKEGVSVGEKCAALHLRIRVNGDVELIGEFSEKILRGVLRVAREAAHVS
jgi:hypothetical protein